MQTHQPKEDKIATSLDLMPIVDDPKPVKAIVEKPPDNIPEKDLAIIFKLESSSGKNLVNPKSSARGLGQIINSTAKTLAKRLNTTQDKVQNDNETNARATALLFSDALKRYKNTEDPALFAHLDQHLGSTDIKKAMKQADDPNNLDSVLKHVKNSETIGHMKKVKTELNK